MMQQIVLLFINPSSSYIIANYVIIYEVIIDVSSHSWGRIRKELKRTLLLLLGTTLDLFKPHHILLAFPSVGILMDFLWKSAWTCEIVAAAMTYTHTTESTQLGTEWWDATYITNFNKCKGQRRKYKDWKK